MRAGRMDDVPAVMGLLRRVVPAMRATGNLQWNEEYPNAEVFEQDAARGQMWIAEVDDTLAGVAAFTTDQEPEYAEVGWDIAEPAIVVHRLAVDPAFRGQGIAVALMLHAEAVALERGIYTLRVDTNTENAATRRLLPRLGYTLAGEIGLGFRPGLRFLCYDKQLQRQMNAGRSPLRGV